MDNAHVVAEMVLFQKDVPDLAKEVIRALLCERKDMAARIDELEKANDSFGDAWDQLEPAMEASLDHAFKNGRLALEANGPPELAVPAVLKELEAPHDSV